MAKQVKPKLEEPVIETIPTTVEEAPIVDVVEVPVPEQETIAKEIKETIEDVTDVIKEATSDIEDIIEEKIEDIKEDIEEIIEDIKDIPSEISEKIEELKQKLEWKWSSWRRRKIEAEIEESQISIVE